jgi:hypothetical protein
MYFSRAKLGKNDEKTHIFALIFIESIIICTFAR